MMEHDPVIGEYEHEKFRPREAEALQTLRKVASLVKPIMRQRGWKVGILTEFWPPEKTLLGLNWNKGQKICLRLRYPYDERQFLPLEEVVDTMLHELCHIVHGPHDEPFHTLWNQLRSEHENLISKGYTGEGFLSAGHKLGGARIPMHEARRRARASAEKRRTLTARSGQKLGGQPVQRGQDIRKVIADAATRRATVTKGCASGTERGRGIVEETTKNGTRTKAEEEDADEEAIMQAYIEMIQQEEREKYGDAYLPPSSINPAGSHGIGIGRAPPPIPTSTKPGNGQKGPVVDLTDYEKPEDVRHPSRIPLQDTWTCDICTLENPCTYLCCDACATERPKSSFRNRSYSPPPQSAPGSSSQSNQPQTGRKNKSIKALSSLNSEASKKPMGWLCHRCGTFMESQWWTCASCGVMKLSS